MALLQPIDKITTGLDNNKFAIGIFLDFSKVFDTVDYNILTVYPNFNILAPRTPVVISWLSDYLRNRDQYVFINGCISHKIALYCGVPQGSILAPLLFLIHINDFA